MMLHNKSNDNWELFKSIDHLVLLLTVSSCAVGANIQTARVDARRRALTPCKNTIVCSANHARQRAWTRQEIEQCSIFPASMPVDARSASAEYVSHML
jgi:hypothetical protein